MVQLETERLSLIHYTLNLVLATIHGHDQLMKQSGLKVSPHWPGDDFIGILPRVAEQMKDNPNMSQWSRLIVYKKERKIIGEIGGKGDPDKTGIIELGYSIVPAYRSNGLATEAMKTFTDWLISLPTIHTITAQCLPDNIPSIRVLQKANFKMINEKHGVTFWIYQK